MPKQGFHIIQGDKSRPCIEVIFIDKHGEIDYVFYDIPRIKAFGKFLHKMLEQNSGVIPPAVSTTIKSLLELEAQSREGVDATAKIAPLLTSANLAMRELKESNPDEFKKISFFCYLLPLTLASQLCADQESDSGRRIEHGIRARLRQLLIDWDPTQLPPEINLTKDLNKIPLFLERRDLVRLYHQYDPDRTDLFLGSDQLDQYVEKIEDIDSGDASEAIDMLDDELDDEDLSESPSLSSTVTSTNLTEDPVALQRSHGGVFDASHFQAPPPPLNEDNPFSKIHAYLTNKFSEKGDFKRRLDDFFDIMKLCKEGSPHLEQELEAHIRKNPFSRLFKKDRYAKARGGLIGRTREDLLKDYEVYKHYLNHLASTPVQKLSDKEMTSISVAKMLLRRFSDQEVNEKSSPESSHRPS